MFFQMPSGKMQQKSKSLHQAAAEASRVNPTKILVLKNIKLVFYGSILKFTFYF